jgi:CubicO group peptidase (beta-lactamase class C family)
VKLALAAEITSRPGTAYEYNNKAICLLPGIIETASGMRMDKFFEETFFKPMEIKNFEWTRDGTGRPQGHAGFRLLARDLAKFGQLMASGGVYNGKRFFEQRWVDSSIASSQAVNPQIGLAWHRYSGRDSVIYFYVDSAQLEFFRNHGMADSIINQLKPIINEPFSNPDQFSARMKNIFGANWKQIMASATKSFPNGERDFWKAKKIEGELKGYYHSGSWGNYLVIVPELKLVAVRVVKRDEEYNRDTDLFGEFVSRAFELTR